MAESTPKKITLGLIIGWALGSFLLLTGIALIFSQPLPGLFVILASLALLPPVQGFLEQKTQVHLSGGVKFVLVLVLFGIAGATMDTASSTNGTVGAPTTSGRERAREEQRQEEAKGYVEVFTFSGNGAKKSEPFTIQGS